MKSNYKELSKNTIIFTLGTFSSKIISFLIIPLYTSVLVESEYGIADLILSYANILIPIFSLCIYDALLRFGLQKTEDAPALLKSCLLVITAGAGLIWLIVPFFHLIGYMHEWSVHICLITITTMYATTLLTYTKVQGRNVLYAVASLITTVAFVGLNLLFLLVFDMGISGYALSSAISQLVCVVFLLVANRTFTAIKGVKCNFAAIKEMLKFSTPLIINNISWWVLNSSNKVIIERFVSSSDLGLFTVASKIPALLSIVTTIFFQAWTISSIKEFDGEKDRKFFSNIFELFYLIMFFGIAVMMLVIKPFMWIYVGEQYFMSWKYVPLLVYGTCFFGFSSFLGAIYTAAKKNVRALLTTTAAAVINLVVSLLLIQKVGVYATVLASLLSYVFLAVYRIVDTRRLFWFPINWHRFVPSSIVALFAVTAAYTNLNLVVTSLISLGLLVVINFKALRSLGSTIRSALSARRG